MKPKRLRVPDLPQELIEEICHRCEYKTICKLRIISKAWNRFLSHRVFLRFYFQKSLEARRSENVQFLAITESTSLQVINCTAEHGYTSRNLEFPPALNENWIDILGTANGATLVVHLAVHRKVRVKSLYLINPDKCNFLEVPRLHFKEERAHYFGFGYDGISEDYKIVTCSYVDSGKRLVKNTFIVYLYSVKENAWRYICDSPYNHYVSGNFSEAGVFVNGCIHWLVCSIKDESLVIVSFDLHSESFSEIKMHKYTIAGRYYNFCLSSINGNLGMSVYTSSRKNFVMKLKKGEHGTHTWERISVFNVEELQVLKVIHQLDNKFVVRDITGPPRFEIYDPVLGRTEPMVVDGNPTESEKGWVLEDKAV